MKYTLLIYVIRDIYGNGMVNTKTCHIDDMMGLLVTIRIAGDLKKHLVNIEKLLLKKGWTIEKL